MAPHVRHAGSTGRGVVKPDEVGLFPKRLELLQRHEVWSRFFEEEAGRIACALASLSPRIEHIGSTAVPGLIAKPISVTATIPFA